MKTTPNKEFSPKQGQQLESHKMAKWLDGSGNWSRSVAYMSQIYTLRISTVYHERMMGEQIKTGIEILMLIQRTFKLKKTVRAWQSYYILAKGIIVQKNLTLINMHQWKGSKVCKSIANQFKEIYTWQHKVMGAFTALILFIEQVNQSINEEKKP